MNKPLLFTLALPLLTCIAAAATPSSPTPAKPDEIKSIDLFIQDTTAQPDAFGLPMSGPLYQPKVATKATAPQAPVITLDMVVNAMQVQMINPPDSILINGRFIQTGSRLQVLYRGGNYVITLASVTPTLVTFTLDDGTQAAIHVQSPNYAQVLTDTPSDTDPMAASPPINLDAKPPGPISHNPNQPNRH